MGLSGSVKERTVWTASLTSGSWSWRKLLRLRTVLLPHMTFRIGMAPGSITWNAGIGRFTNDVAYELFQPRGPKVGWSSLLLGPLKIPRNTFVLWLAILGHLSTMDKPWLHTIDNHCVLCRGGHVETHQHLFFDYQYSYLCITTIRRGMVWMALSRLGDRGSLGLLDEEGQPCGSCGIQDLIGLSSLSYLARTQSETVSE
ncbi:UNVERIFIED_CONTAM: hypothetical protein Slati_2189500 [Sesamum latifolium]|uniref:Reverse transcriptase zinc-binding domain-containing protein n=1 Tax=Sesamum latifolium TaxID=2727402 RepID=A0AAW2WT33_9LAMI